MISYNEEGDQTLTQIALDACKEEKQFRGMKIRKRCKKYGKGRILILLLGFLIGLVFGTWIYKKNNTFVHHFMKCHHNYEVGRRPQSISEELHPSLLVLVGMLVEIAEIRTQARILYNDWAASIPGKIVFFIVKKTNRSSLNNVGISVVDLEGIPSNSKIEIKYLAMLRYISSHYLSRFKWLMLAQHDSFINIDKLGFLRHLNYLKDFILIPERDQMQHEGFPKQTSDLFSPGIIISSTFLQKISVYLAHCFHRFTTIQNGDVHTCFQKSFTIDWNQDQQELNTTGRSKNFPNVCKNIDDEDVTNIVTADLSRDAHCMYRLQVWLLSQKLRINGRNYVKLKNKRDILKELITSDVYQQRSRVKRKDNNSKRYGFIFTMNRIFSLKTQLSWRMTENEKQGMGKVKANVMDKLREAHSRDENLKFGNLHYGYISINPLKEIEYVLDIYTDTFDWHLATARQVFGRLEKKIVQTASTLATVNIIVPLAGKLESFKYFMANLEKNILIKREPVSLLVVYFPEKLPPREHLKIFDTYKTKFPWVAFNWLNLTGEFARANALQAGVRFYKENSLLFIVDIDLTFNSDFLQRCRDHTVYKQRAYFPVMFKYFNPKIGGSRPNSSIYFKFFQRQIGFWALHSFGPLCAYSNDIMSVGGFNVHIKQWGFEDIQLFERFLYKNYDIIRAADPGLLHIYHPHTLCDVISNLLQRRMCNGAMLNGLGSRETLAKYLLAKNHLIL